MGAVFDVLPGEELEHALRRASAYLHVAGVPSPRVDAELLAAYCLEQSTGESVSRGRVQALALAGQQVPPGYAEYITRRASREPLQHITGRAAFRRLELQVGQGVFIPRPETEILVEYALAALHKMAEPQPLVIDLCTGSGAIAAAIKNEFPKAQVYAVEISRAAYSWTQKNLEPLGVHTVLGDALQELPELLGQAQLVTANPPYIPVNAIPQDLEVSGFDPEQALYGGSQDGMAIPTAMTHRAYDLLQEGGYYIAEHDETQRELMRTTLAQIGFEAIESINDLAGRARHTAGTKPAPSEQLSISSMKE